jgi:hypothetical protein
MAVDREKSTTFFSSDKQQLPEGDNRYRVNPAATFYVAQLDCGTRGCTLNVSESARRVLHFRSPQAAVVFETRQYALHPAAELKPFIDGYVKRGCNVYVGGIAVSGKTMITPAPFIFVSPSMLSRFDELHAP